tara:strand:+ start:2964 stop:3236 length:273 start_codon:yes stop_codon:yes gene_type:complete
MWTQETTKTGHVASFQSDSGISYVWANQFDFDAGIDTAQFTITPVNYHYSQIDIFFTGGDDSYECTKQYAQSLADPESDIADWAEMAFHF